ncbi:DUF4350 domain-containing protein [Parasphingorhabdus sp. JC815]|uniref:DUF4350 domain-containing protein n=1 Tax=Parasphingorhabdus sp. JC815 TaxID=3232140 RepID=UPI003458320A
MDSPSSVKIQMMTSLPIIWGEGASMENIISGKASPAPIYAHWQKHYDITAVDSFEGLEKSDTDIVLLVQPPAMDPADLAAIDTWVRAGGNAIILTDPQLIWPSSLPLGDKRRPLASGLLSPILGRWNLELQITDDAARNVKLETSGATVTAVGVGAFKLAPRPENGQVECVISAAKSMARCKLDEGRATLVADADFLNDALWPDPVGNATPDAARLIDIFIAELRK